MTDGKQERLPLLPAGCRQSSSGATTALSIDRSMTKRNSRLVADAQLSGAESRCRIWASTVEGQARVFLAQWGVRRQSEAGFRHKARSHSDKNALVVRPQGIACFGKMMARPAAAIVWGPRCGRICRCSVRRVTAPGPGARPGDGLITSHRVRLSPSTHQVVFLSSTLARYDG